VGGVWRGLVGAAGPEARLEQLSYLRVYLVVQVLMIESGLGDHPQALNLIKERFLLSGAANSDRLFSEYCGWS